MLVQGLEALPLPLELMSVVALHGVGVGYDLRVDPLNFCHLWGCELVRSIIIMTHNRVGVNIIMSRTELFRRWWAVGKHVVIILLSPTELGLG